MKYIIELTSEELETLQEMLWIGFEKFSDMDNLINVHSIQDKLTGLLEEIK